MIRCSTLFRFALVLSALAPLASVSHASLPDPTQPAGDWISAPPLQMWTPALGWDASGRQLLALGRTTSNWDGFSLWGWSGAGVWERLLVLEPSMGWSQAVSAFDPKRHRFYVMRVNSPRDSVTLCWCVEGAPSPRQRELGTAMPGARATNMLFVDVARDRLIAVNVLMNRPSSPYAIWARSLADTGQWRMLREIPNRGLPSWFRNMALDARRSRLVWQKTVEPPSGVVVDSTLALPLEGTGDWELLSARAIPRKVAAAALVDSLADRFVIVSEPPTAGAPLACRVDALDLAGAGDWTTLADLPRSYGRGFATAPGTSEIWSFGGLPAAEILRLRPEAGAAWETVNTFKEPLPFWWYTQLLLADPFQHRVVCLGPAMDRAPLDSTSRMAVWSMSLEHPTGWRRIEATGDAPPLLMDPSVVLDPLRRRGLLFGGSVSPGRNSSDVWSLTLDEVPYWSRLDAGPGPSPRWGSMLAFDPVGDRMILIGGEDAGGALTDVWELRFAPSPHWVAPPVRRDFDFEIRGCRALRDPADGAILVLPNTTQGRFPALVPGDTAVWTRRGVTAGGGSISAWYAAAAYDPIGRRGFLHGGFGFEWYVNFEYSGGLSDTSTWLQVSSAGQRSPARGGHTAVYDGIGDQLIVGPEQSGYGDTWFLRFDRPERAAPWAIAADGAGVHLDWFAKGPPGLEFLVQRRTPSEPWTTLGTSTATGEHVTWSDAAVRTGERYGYRLAWPSGADTLWCEESWTYGPAATGAVALAGAWPNPSRGQSVTLAFTLADASAARLELFDITGRRVWSRATGGAVGRQLATVDASLPPGVYVARVAQGARRATARIVVVK